MSSNSWQVVAVQAGGRRTPLKQNISRETAENLRRWLSDKCGTATLLVAPLDDSKRPNG